MTRRVWLVVLLLGGTVEAAEPSKPIRVVVPERCVIAGNRAYNMQRAIEIPGMIRTLLAGDTVEFEGRAGLCVVALTESPKAEIADLVVPRSLVKSARTWKIETLLALARQAIHSQYHGLWVSDCKRLILPDGQVIEVVRERAGGACAHE